MSSIHAFSSSAHKEYKSMKVKFLEATVAVMQNATLTNALLVNATLNTPLIINGTLNTPVLNNPTLNTPTSINGVFTTPVIINATGSMINAILSTPTLTNPIINTPTVTNGVFTTPTIINATGSMINAILSTPTITNGTGSTIGLTSFEPALDPHPLGFGGSVDIFSVGVAALSVGTPEVLTTFAAFATGSITAIALGNVIRLDQLSGSGLTAVVLKSTFYCRLTSTAAGVTSLQYVLRPIGGGADLDLSVFAGNDPLQDIGAAYVGLYSASLVSPIISLAAPDPLGYRLVVSQTGLAGVETLTVNNQMTWVLEAVRRIF